MSRRPTTQAPRIPGLTFRSLVGSGGFADVYLCTEEVLGREVAVKVLATVPTPAERASFDSEANVMAQLSSHPAIVPIYAVGEAPDGRPYMTMEYCGGESLSSRYRRAPLGVPEVLELGVRVCAAVETAHRAGVLHRDVKPANILTTAFGTPKLADFGISHLLGGGGESVAGFSVPWSPPEVFAEHSPVDPRTDVWSLAATFHTLLSGRTPFEVGGGPNDTAALMSRIETAPTPRLEAPGAPASLVRLLASGMDKELDRRPSSAMALARSLQEVQIELRLPTTRIDVLDASTTSTAGPGEDERTSVRPITVIVPDDPSSLGSGLLTPPPLDDRTTKKPASLATPPTPAPYDATLRPPETTTTPDPDLTPTASPAAGDGAGPATGAPARRTPLVLAGVGVLAVGVLAGALLLGGGGAGEDDVQRLDSGTTAPPVANDPVDLAPPSAPVRVRGRMDGPDAATFSWRAPDAEPGDAYRWTLSGDGGDTFYTLVDGTTARVEVPPGRRPCIVVTAVRAGQQSAPSALTCAGGR